MEALQQQSHESQLAVVPGAEANRRIRQLLAKVKAAEAALELAHARIELLTSERDLAEERLKKCQMTRTK